MKIFAILICLIIGSALAKAVSTIALDPEKASGVFPVQVVYQHDTFDYSIRHTWPELVEPSTDEWIYGNITLNEFGYYWMPEVSGVGHDNTGRGSSDQNVTMGGTSFDGDASFLAETWEEYNPGTYIGVSYETNSDGTATPSEPYAGGILPLAVVKEYRDQEDQQHPPAMTFLDVDHYESIAHHSGYKEKRETLWLLRTGGKGIIGRKNLWRIWGSATNCSGQAIPNSQIEIIQGKRLYPDGSRWIALQDGTEFDVTPRVAGRDCYTYDVGAAEYPLIITAACSRFQAGADLEATNAPQFCVGERVTFDALWEFGQPPWDGVVSQWTLPDKYVNETWQHSYYTGGGPPVPPVQVYYGSVNYRKNASLLKSMTTPCWYVNKPGGNVNFQIDMRFSNGQLVRLTRQGEVEIYRPQPIFSSFTTVDPQHPSLSRSFLWDGEILSYGNSVTGEHALYWGITVNSKYDGVVGIEQLVNALFTQNHGWCPFCRDTLDTHGTFWLDGNTENYTDKTYFVGLPASHVIALDDSPALGLSPPIWTHSVRLWGKYKDYLRFRPTLSPNNNIFVTIGINDWSMEGKATDSSGITVNDTPAPSAVVDSDEFPTWTGQKFQ
jgi:hypothetical protein